MKTKYNLYSNISSNLKLTLFVTGVLLVFTAINSCKKDDNNSTNDLYSLSDLGGTWQRHSLITSSSNNGFWIYGTIINNDASSTVHLILPTGHNLDTVYTEKHASISSEGVITTTDDLYAHSYLSNDKNLMVGTTVRNSLYTLVFDQKTISGTSYSSADLQGTWQTHYLAGGGSWTGWIHATSTIGSNGNYTVSNLVKSDGNTNIASGIFSISSVGVITVAGLTTYHGFMSPDKTLIVTNMTDGGGGGGLSIAQKVVAGTNYSLADLEGTWQIHDILVGSENWTEHGIVTVDANGSGVMSNMIKDNGGNFVYHNPISLSITSEGIITYGTDVHGFMSADKKLFVSTSGDDSGRAYMLIISQKMP
jgi:hypothetical protein